MNDILNTVERIRLKVLIDRELDGLFKRASELGEHMGKLFKKDARSQLRNLESVAAAATRTSSLKNHVKNQTGKDKERREEKQTWARSGAEKALGEELMALLQDLADRSTKIVARLPHRVDDEEGREIARGVEIELQRGLVQTAVAAALYVEDAR